MADGNVGRQLLAPAYLTGLYRADDGWEVREPRVFPLRRRGMTPAGETGLEISDEALSRLPADPGGELRWVTNTPPTPPGEVISGLANRFTLLQEDPDQEPSGLRVPQVGAVHAVLAHWSTRSREPATVVLPTGTGKTDTMIALYASEELPRLLILVPNDNLRTQIAEEFERWGVLGEVGALDPEVLGPVVGRIEHAFENAASMRRFVEACNVIVTTPHALNASSESVVTGIIDRSSHLFIDEAHHVPAATWSQVRSEFAPKPVVQFTATPYRNDGHPLGGRVIYAFPLGLARELGYFESISYISVVALTNPDREVATKAVARLRADLEGGFDHLIMARAASIGRATEDLLPLYEEIAGDLNPQLLHSNLGASARREALMALRNRQSRVMVCVDMFGEGFNFPELKIAALHDPHRSLAPTLQFIGRFARKRSDLGSATAVVARPDPGYDSRLRKLYAEDNQWDAVIENLSVEAVEEVRELDEFDAGFSRGGDDEISIHVLRPKMSAVVYATGEADWEPDRLADLFPAEQIVGGPSVNPTERVAWVVVESRDLVRWGDLHAVENVSYHLHVLHWDQHRRLLYINSSDLESLQQDLAEAVCGEGVQRITGDHVYRALGEITRPVPTNIGLISLRSRARRFSMFVGSDVYEGFAVAEQQTRTNTNIFVLGYERGERVTRGAARKGRIWSQQAARSIYEWVQWCRQLGPLLQDDSINLDGLLRSFVRPKPLQQRPELPPLAIDWSITAYGNVTESLKVKVGDSEPLLLDTELVLTNQQEQGPIEFELRGHGFEPVRYAAEVLEDQLVVTPHSEDAEVVRERADPLPLSRYLNQEGITIWFDNEVMIEGPELLLELERDRPPIDLDRLRELDWTGIDITRESQGPTRDQATVQARAAAELIGLRDWDVVIDDDGTGEIADLVGLKLEDDRLIVHLVHCKYSSESNTGARVGDLYEVCGQAHRSAHRRQAIPATIKNLVRRERNRQAAGTPGVMVGTAATLLELEEAATLNRSELHVTVVQPGLSKTRAAQRHLELLASAEVYVSEVASGFFDVWCSP